MKRERLPRVVGHYAKAIREMNGRGQWPVDSDLAIVLERASEALSLQSETGKPLQAHSKTEYKRLSAQGANVLPPEQTAAHQTPRTDRVAEHPVATPMHKIGLLADLARQLERENAELRARLEVSPDHGWDGIACRDETIRLQDRHVDELRAQLAEAERQHDEAMKDAAAKQAQIDRLMLEYCPDEMTPEQMEEWSKHQVPAIDAAIKESK